MPARSSTVGSVTGAVFGTIGLSALAGLLVTVMVAPAIAVTGVTAASTVQVFEDLPEYIELDQGAQQNQIVVVNADGSEQVIATIWHQNREEIPLEEMSPHLIDAAIAGEDRRFYEHGGVDVPSVVRAAVGQVLDISSSGASTLTMQTVRNMLWQEIVNDESLTAEQKKAEEARVLDATLDRKLREMKLAIGLEKRYTKDEILQAYLNIAGFGGSTYGVQAASEQYFSKNAKDLTVAEAASLIAIVQFPNDRNLGNADNFPRNQARRDVILHAMFQEGFISQTELDEALAIPVDANFVRYSPPRQGCFAAPVEFRWPCEYATKNIVLSAVDGLGGSETERLSNWKQGGYKLYLSITPDLQRAATATLTEWAPKDEVRFPFAGATDSVEVGTGRILSMVVNKDFDPRLNADGTSAGGPTTTALNYAVDKAHGGSGGFQPGSTYKPYVLLAFLDAGHGLHESYDASVITVDQADYEDTCNGPWAGGPPYEFDNDSRERGTYSVLNATARSINSIFIQMAQEVNQCRIAELAASIGLHRADGAQDGSLPFAEGGLQTRPSCAIGGCENNLDPLTQAAAYAAIANQGVYCAPIIVDKVRMRDGTELPGQPQQCGQSKVTPNVANTAAYAMRGVFQPGGTAASARPDSGTPYIGKTGTANEASQLWLVGTSTRVATAVWVGNTGGDATRQSLRKIYIKGTRADYLRLRIFEPIAEAVDAIYPGSDFAEPDPTLLRGVPVFVPDNLIGIPVEQAKSAIETAGLAFSDAGEVDSDLPAGVVARTDPAPGSSVSRGTTVSVWRSNGQGAAVPDVVGQDVDSARAELNDAGFGNIAEVCEPAPGGGDGGGGGPGGGIGGGGIGGGGIGGGEETAQPSEVAQVIAQDPGAGSFVNRNTTVTLTVQRSSCP